MLFKSRQHKTVVTNFNTIPYPELEVIYIHFSDRGNDFLKNGKVAENSYLSQN